MRNIATIALALLASTMAFAESPFAGTWKPLRDKSEMDSKSGVITVQSEGKGIRYASSISPIYGGALDGSKRPALGDMGNDTFTLKHSGERGYEAVLHRNGKAVTREVVEVSPDGNTMTTSFTVLTPRKDGKQVTNVFTYNRTGGEPTPFPFIGTWKIDRSLTRWGEEPIPMIITEAGGVLTIGNPVNDAKTVLDLNHGTVTGTGPTRAMDTKQAVKAIDERSFERSYSRGPLTAKSVHSVSPDRKTMTVISTSMQDGKTTTSTFHYQRH